jgi:hypothetical protein
VIPSTKRTVQLLDETYSARPLAQILAETLPPGEIIAVYKVRRDAEYGLSFYRDHQVVNYDQDDAQGRPQIVIPDQQHILVVRESYVPELGQFLQGRTYEPLFTYPAQNLVIYVVSARQ